MPIANRTELIPAELAVVETGAVALGVVGALLSGSPTFLVVPVVAVLLYAFGAYDPVTYGRDYFVTIVVPLLGAVAIYWAVTASRGVHTLDLVLVSAVAAGFALLHLALRRLLVSAAVSVDLAFGASDRALAGEIARQCAHLGYPARVTVADDDASPRATISRVRTEHPDDPSVTSGPFDPIAFCDVALRVLPPRLVAKDLSVLGRSRKPLYEVVKRAIDLVIALPLLVVTLPLWVIASLAILVSDGRPVFFLQPRVGRAGRRFRIVKFRTLRRPPEDSTSPTDRIERRHFTVGTLLRRSRVDELPQLLNVIAGQMSLVGPRPEMEYYHERQRSVIPTYALRLIPRPGLTGWAQIRYPHSTNDEEYYDKTGYDLWYVRHRSILLDIRIALRTIGILARRFGSR